MNKKRARQKRYAANKPPEWHVWRGMKERCSNNRHLYYDIYGGRGVKVCARWRAHGTGFAAFMEDMGARPSPHHHLDRIDPDGDYAPDNCRWIPRTENCSRARRQILEVHSEV